jgi:hypothetical protein
MKIAKSRSWTGVEVQEAVAALKREPWEELERIEATTGEFREVETGPSGGADRYEASSRMRAKRNHRSPAGNSFVSLRRAWAEIIQEAAKSKLGHTAGFNSGVEYGQYPRGLNRNSSATENLS